MKKKLDIIIGMVLLLLCSILFAAVTGSSTLSMMDSIKIILSRIPVLGPYIDLSNIRSTYIQIVWDIRMPRIFMAGLVGGGLSVVGAAFQGIFKNPLADPHILGVSSGAALGATVAMMTGVGLNLFGLGMVGIFAFATSLLTVVCVYRIACIGNRLSTVNMILTGTAFSMMLSALISLLLSLHHENIEKVYLWILGSFSAASWNKVVFLCLFVLMGTVCILFFSKDLDAIATGYEMAESLGIDTVLVRKLIIVFASLIVAACVSVSGIIGFVGLVIPHSIRLISGPQNRRLIPLSGLGGAIFVIFSDTLARNLVAPSEIPVGVITALLGSPYFIILLQRSKRKLGSGS